MLKGLLILVFGLFGVVLSDEYINADGNFTQIPTDIPDLVTHISIRYSTLGFVEYIKPFPLLEYLDLSFDKLTRFPNLANVSSTLKTLILSNNELDLEDGIPYLAVLKELDLSFNNLTYVPDLSKVSATLERLIVKDNHIISVDTLPLMPLTYFLNFYNNDLVSFPNLTNVPNLKVLDLWNNKIEFVENVPDHSQLSFLTLSLNALIHFPLVDNALQLEFLYLDSNKITQVDYIPLLPKLKFLSVKYNKLTQFPDVSNLSSALEILDCSYNEIQLVDVIPEMGRLVKLILSHNKIIMFPDLHNVGNTLEELYLDFNDMNLIQNDVLVLLPNLKLLTLGDSEGKPLSLPNFCVAGNKTGLSLKLYADELLCNSEVLYMNLAVMTGKLEISTEGIDPVCAEPTALAGIRITDLTKDKLIRTASANYTELVYGAVPSLVMDNWACPLSFNVKPDLFEIGCAAFCMRQSDCYMFTVYDRKCIITSTTGSLDYDVLYMYNKWYRI